MKLTDIIHQIADRQRLGMRVAALTGGTKAVDAIIVTAGGTGYTVAPTVVFAGGGGGSGAAATATVVAGVVTAVTVTNAGSGYLTTPTISFTPVSGGSGATASAQMLGTSLDAIPTLSVSISYTLFIFVLLSSRVNIYRLRAGTDAEVSPFIIRPDDYATTTNEKVWELIGVNPLQSSRPVKTLTYAGTTNIDMSSAEMWDLAITGNLTLTTSQKAAGEQTFGRIVADSSSRTLTFPSWVFIGGAAPGSLAANKAALLELWCYGTADTDIVARITVQP